MQHSKHTRQSYRPKWIVVHSWNLYCVLNVMCTLYYRNRTITRPAEFSNCFNAFAVEFHVSFVSFSIQQLNIHKTLTIILIYIYSHCENRNVAKKECEHERTKQSDRQSVITLLTIWSENSRILWNNSWKNIKKKTRNVPNSFPMKNWRIYSNIWMIETSNIWNIYQIDSKVFQNMFGVWNEIATVSYQF